MKAWNELQPSVNGQALGLESHSEQGLRQLSVSKQHEAGSSSLLSLPKPSESTIDDWESVNARGLRTSLKD